MPTNDQNNNNLGNKSIDALNSSDQQQPTFEKHLLGKDRARLPSLENETFGFSLNVFKAMVDDLSCQYEKPKTSVIKILMENTCEYRSKHELLKPYSQYKAQKFDSYFAIKHEFGKCRFVQRLGFALKQHGLQACISTEKKHTVGVFDVLITTTRSLVTISHKDGLKIVVEWKSGASFSLSQLERYLWEADVIVLVRVLLKQVVKISRMDIEGYLKRSLLSLSERALAISRDEHPQKIPGPYCKTCYFAECEFYKESTSQKTISFDSESMREDILSVFNNIESCIDETIKVVIAELTYDGKESLS
jgi:hypothetical protein